MSSYRLLSDSTVLVDIPSSSSLDNPDVRETRRGTVFKTLQKNIVQYTATAFDDRIVWNIPVANASQYGILYSASVGAYGPTLTLVSPVYGNINVAMEPGPDGFIPEKYAGSFGTRITIRFVRLA